MYYTSTRGGVERVNSLEAVLNGLARDGGLYVPVDLQKPFSAQSLMTLDFYGMAERVFAYFLDDFDDIPALVRRAYDGKFEKEDVTPLVKVGDRYLLELFHGPTAAFKDVALSALPVFMSEALRKQGSDEEIMILTATSGDTGKAAMEGFKDVPGIRIIVFYPYQGVSPIQERQMTSQEGSNVRACAIRGNFDDAQTAVKAIFSRVSGEGLPKDMKTRLSSANSINIGRLVPQIVYYFKAYADLVKQGVVTYGERVDFTVPTGNFGDILAGYFAKKMGLPVGRLICASNENKVLTDFLRTGTYDKNRDFHKTTSPSMDILVSSNLERLLYLECGESGEKVRALMEALKNDGVYTVPAEMLQRIQADFGAGFATSEEGDAAIRAVFLETGYLMDPHTAVAWCVSSKTEKSGAAAEVILSTASPYKFPETVLKDIGGMVPSDPFAVMDALEEASGIPAPKNLKSLREKPVRFRDVVDREELYDYVMKEIEKR